MNCGTETSNDRTNAVRPEYAELVAELETNFTGGRSISPMNSEELLRLLTDDVHSMESFVPLVNRDKLTGLMRYYESKLLESMDGAYLPRNTAADIMMFFGQIRSCVVCTKIGWCALAQDSSIPIEAPRCGSTTKNKPDKCDLFGVEIVYPIVDETSDTDEVPF